MQQSRHAPTERKLTPNNTNSSEQQLQPPQAKSPTSASFLLQFDKTAVVNTGTPGVSASLMGVSTTSATSKSTPPPTITSGNVSSSSGSTSSNGSSGQQLHHTPSGGGKPKPFPLTEFQDEILTLSNQSLNQNTEQVLMDDFKFGDLIVVSNRLPMTISRNPNSVIIHGNSNSSHGMDSKKGVSKDVHPQNKHANHSQQQQQHTPQQSPQMQDHSSNFIFKKSSGGLVTALTGMCKGQFKKDFKWIGWIGTAEFELEEEKAELRHELEKFNQYPVFLEAEEAHKYYDGFSNGVLWPLFHYLYEKNVTFNMAEWEAYQRVNEKFADAVLEVYKDNDAVWIHDYHLMLLPAILRHRRPDINIAFFLHIPFPSSEIYRILPVRSQLLEGLLASNMVAFHTYDFARHFLSSCTRTLGSDTTPRGLLHKGLFVSVHSLPIGIDPNMFREGVQSDECRKILDDFKNVKYKGKKIVLGIDRLDYTKGVQLKFEAFEKFLTNYPQYANDTVLIQVGVPTRPNVVEYQELLSHVNETTGRINSTFGTLTHGFPVHFLYKSVALPELCALYTLADVCLVTSIRDGMNLVSSEYVVCQDEAVRLGVKSVKELGVLILSEFAGAARSLGGSIIINPWDIDQTMKAIKDGLDMKPAEKHVRHKANISIIMRNTASQWASDFMQEFESACRYQKDPTVFNKLTLKGLPALKLEALIPEYQSEQKRLFLFDYDGTLVKMARNPMLALPSERCLEMLKHLCSDPNNHVYIITGRDQYQMTEFVGSIKELGIASEHGLFCRHPNSEEFTSSLYNIDLESLNWIGMVREILEHVSSRTPGSFVEVKRSSLAFHYRNSDPDYGEWIVNELKLHLEMAFNSLPLEIIKGRNKFLEIRPQSVSKGACARKLIERGDYGFIFCAGDDNTDEAMFEEVERHSRKNITPMSPTPSTPTIGVSSVSSQGSESPWSPKPAQVHSPQSPSHRYTPAVGGFARNTSIIIPKSVFSVFVGNDKIVTKARYHVGNIDHLMKVLEGLPVAQYR
ncbi:hypothetical protein C9374_014446 [Naegleria lovaniensis]|uniref:Alpha,alpha-trehalose-phosphate synthase (UDP-forming) n=1 Tax=Naegleria lovaniensis TaxID=51637 RepID=A0AA88GZV0_NAELO|nr:uncharacterized protein C9374_014446 [Naegleria lovaniensis]KAG2389046.1 hypothetical protein C9374_014446 [Naegleria lovaniensis]